MALQGDVSDPDTADALFTALEEEFGPVLVLVNNAGVRADGLAPMIDDDDWDRGHRHQPVRRLPAHPPRAAADDPQPLRARGQHRLDRRSAFAATPGQANYAASKAGLVAMTKTVAAEVARRGVTVNAVAPGLIETDMTEGIADELAGARARPPGRDTGRGGRVRALPGVGRRRVRDRRVPHRRRWPHRLNKNKEEPNGSNSYT